MCERIFRIEERRRQAQATVEMAVALILSVVLLVAAAKIFVWLNGSTVLRQKMYEETRVAAGSQVLTVITDLNDPSQTGGVMTDDANYPALNLFQDAASVSVSPSVLPPYSYVEQTPNGELTQ